MAKSLPVPRVTFRSKRSVEIDLSDGASAIDMLTGELCKEAQLWLRRFHKKPKLHSVIANEMLTEVNYLTHQLPAEIVRQMLLFLMAKHAKEMFDAQIASSVEKQQKEAKDPPIQ